MEHEMLQGVLPLVAPIDTLWGKCQFLQTMAFFRHSLRLILALAIVAMYGTTIGASGLSLAPSGGCHFLCHSKEKPQQESFQASSGAEEDRQTEIEAGHRPCCPSSHVCLCTGHATIAVAFAENLRLLIPQAAFLPLVISNEQPPLGAPASIEHPPQLAPL